MTSTETTIPIIGSAFSFLILGFPGVRAKRACALLFTLFKLMHIEFFNCKFDPEELLWDKTWGAIGLNDPRGNTRKGQLFHNIASAKEGIQVVPNIDTTEEPPLPMGIAGNSAYIIRPYAARELLKKVETLGMWPNDAIMCKQLFPWLRVVYPYYTNTQENTSTTTQL